MLYSIFADEDNDSDSLSGLEQVTQFFPQHQLNNNNEVGPQETFPVPLNKISIDSVAHTEKD